MLACIGGSFAGFNWNLRWPFIRINNKFIELGRGLIGCDTSRRMGIFLSFVLVDIGFVEIGVELVPETG